MVEAVLLAMAGPRFGCTSSLPPLLPLLLMMMIALALTLKSPALARSHCSVRNATVAIEDTLCGTCYDVNTTICQGACVTKQSYALHGRSVQRACVYSEVRYEAALLPGCPARPPRSHRRRARRGVVRVPPLRLAHHRLHRAERGARLLSTAPRYG
ncbi:unnamed protein product [Lampetra fluviatilis]